jgi:hypothetical protein
MFARRVWCSQRAACSTEDWMDEQVIYEPYEPPPLFRHAEILEMSLVVPDPISDMARATVLGSHI